MPASAALKNQKDKKKLSSFSTSQYAHQAHLLALQKHDLLFFPQLYFPLVWPSLNKYIDKDLISKYGQILRLGRHDFGGMLVNSIFYF